MPKMEHHLTSFLFKPVKCICFILSPVCSDACAPVSYSFNNVTPCGLQICAVLAAVTDVIRAQGGKETETEYFAALVSAGACSFVYSTKYVVAY